MDLGAIRTIPGGELLLCSFLRCSCSPRSTMYVRVGKHHFLPLTIVYQIYGMPSFLSGNGFTNAQCTCSTYCSLLFWLTLLDKIPALLNIIETLINIAYLYLAHIAQWPAAPMIGFGAALMTLSKTVLYWAQEYYCGFCAVGHNKVWDLVLLWIVPNGCTAFLLRIVCTFADVTL